MLIVFVLSSVCCSTGVGDAVQDLHDLSVCLVDSVYSFVLLNVVLFYLVCCSTGVDDVVRDRHDPICLVFCVLFNWRW